MDEYEARKADEIYNNLRQRRREQEEAFMRKENKRSETRAIAKVGSMDMPTEALCGQLII